VIDSTFYPVVSRLRKRSNWEGRGKELQQYRDDIAEEKVPYGNKTKEVRLVNEMGNSRDCSVRSFATPGIDDKEHERNDRESLGPIIDLTEDDVPIDLTGSEDDASQFADCSNGIHGKSCLKSWLDIEDQEPNLESYGKFLTRTPATPKTSFNGSGTEGQSWFTITGPRHGAAMSLNW